MASGGHLGGFPAGLRLAHQPCQQIGALLAADGEPVSGGQEDRRHPLALEVLGPLAAAGHQAIADERAGADHADELDLRGDAQAGALPGRALAGRLGQRVEELDLVGAHRLQHRPPRAAVGGAHLDDLGDAGVGMVLDELAGDEAAGTVPQQHDLAVAHAAQAADVPGEVGAAGHLIGGDRLGIGEGVHVGLLGQALDEQAAGLLPAVQGRPHHAHLAEGMQVEPVQEDDGPRLAGGARGDAAVAEQRRDLDELRVEGSQGQEGQGANRREHGILRRAGKRGERGRPAGRLGPAGVFPIPCYLSSRTAVAAFFRESSLPQSRPNRQCLSLPPVRNTPPAPQGRDELSAGHSRSVAQRLVGRRAGWQITG